MSDPPPPPPPPPGERVGEAWLPAPIWESLAASSAFSRVAWGVKPTKETPKSVWCVTRDRALTGERKKIGPVRLPSAQGLYY